MEFTNIKGNTWAACGPVNIGAYIRNGETVLIDSGNDSSAGRKLLRLAEEKNWKIKLIINTHFHADHVGGNAFIQKRTGCGVAASAKEAPFIDMPEMEPEILWSGRAPKAICNKFLQAEPSKVTRIVEADSMIEGFGLKIIPLPGHAHGQIGILTPDSVFFTADAVISKRILNKYGIPFTADYSSAMLTFDKLEQFYADFFVPSHGDICEDIVPSVCENRRCLAALRDEILDICSEPSTRDEIVGRLASRHGLDMNISQYVLIHSTTAAVISPLIDSGELVCSFEKGTLSLKKI
ncbi:MAG: MBL fold metallo-hydrolase, partial [Synergistaceae bacterium]|nr:MBL fold metallo-hydrolase [Synergistaceae bacterium]